MLKICSERREQEVFEQLLAMISGLDERLADASDEDHGHICAMVNMLIIFV